MTDEPRDTASQWGRPLRRRSKGPKPQSAEAPPGVGPVEDPSAAGAPGAIIRSERPVESQPREVLGAPRRREPAAPEAPDFELRDLIAHIARGLVDQPDDVQVEILTAGSDAAFELRVHPDDLGHVIGKQGRTARSIRLALGAAAAKRGRRASLDIAD